MNACHSLSKVLGNKLLRETEGGREDGRRVVLCNKRVDKVQETRKVALVVVSDGGEDRRHLGRNANRVLDVQALRRRIV